MRGQNVPVVARTLVDNRVSFSPVPPSHSPTISDIDGYTQDCKRTIVNAMTIDVEDYYQVSAFDPYIEKDDWSSYPSRVEANVDRILEIFESKSISATFFILGYVAQQHPGMVQRIASLGHEIASHGWKHYRVTAQSPKEFAEDIRKTKTILEDISGDIVKGYRAASYSVSEDSLWAHEELASSGHLYSSSIVPIKHDHYGIPEAPRFPFHVNPSGLLEVPVSTVAVNGKNYPCGGGGWFRLYPYSLSRLALNSIVEKENRPCVFYFHPWEIDPDQPRISGLPMKTKFRHYVNLPKMEGKICSLLDDFKWGRMDEIYLKTPTLESLTNM